MRPLRALSIAATLALCVVSLAANVTGKWKGKVLVDDSKLPKAKSPEQQKQRDLMVKVIKGTQFSLNLKGDKTWTLDVTISAKGPNGKPLSQHHTVDGTWKMDGANVQLTEIHQDGQPSKDRTPETLTPINGGRALRMMPPKGKSPEFMTGIIFTRGGKG